MHPEEKSELYRIMSDVICASRDNVELSGLFLPESIEHACLCGGSSSFYGCPQQGSSSDSGQARALRNHKEAEKRRRERINSHLDKLRSVLPCSSKTDKASLLAKVVDRVRELKQEALMEHQQQLSDQSNCVVPSESDEVSVVHSTNDDDDGGRGGRLVFKASLCCKDRSDLLPELMGILKSLRLKTLRAEMSTVGGRVQNVLIVAADKAEHSIESVHFLQSALKGLLVQASGGATVRSKRRRIVAAASTTHHLLLS